MDVEETHWTARPGARIGRVIPKIARGHETARFRKQAIPRQQDRPRHGYIRDRPNSMEITVDHLGAVQFEITARGHRIVSDQPEDQGGFDEGMTPPELLLASLGSCTAYYVAEYLKRHKLASEGTRVRILAEKVKNPARLDNFRIEVRVPVEISAEHQNGVREAVHRCLIHNTLLNPPHIELDVAAPVPAA